MLKTKRQIEQEAIGWVIRLRHAEADDWEAFTVWLEQDPVHAAVYDEASLADADAQELLPSSHEPVTPRPSRPILPIGRPVPRYARRAFVGWGIAASLIAMTGWGMLSSGSGSYILETGAGERRQVALADGSRIELNGSTRVMLDEDRPRYARLERGEALFRVIHDPGRPFEVEAGDSLLRDLGTTFNVVHEKSMLEVAVSEGAVLFNPGREAKNLKPGMGLRKAPGAPLWVGWVDREAVGGWHEARLVYSAAPMSRIAAGLSRNLGVGVGVAPDVANRPFSGVIMLDGERAAVLHRATALLGLSLRRADNGWILSSRNGSTS